MAGEFDLTRPIDIDEIILRFDHAGVTYALAIDYFNPLSSDLVRFFRQDGEQWVSISANFGSWASDADLGASMDLQGGAVPYSRTKARHFARELMLIFPNVPDLPEVVPKPEIITGPNEDAFVAALQDLIEIHFDDGVPRARIKE